MLGVRKKMFVSRLASRLLSGLVAWPAVILSASVCE